MANEPRLRWMIFVVILAAVACGKGRSPTDPTPPTTTTQPAPTVGGVGGYVFAGSDPVCLVGAVVEVVDGPKAGAKVEQKDCPFGDAYGYDLEGLPANTLVTVRASAAGYRSAELRVYAQPMVFQTNFTLSKE